MSLLVRIAAPAHSRRGKLVRRYIARWRNGRLLRVTRARYNKSRFDYYQHIVMKQVADQHLKVSIVVPCFNTPAKYFEPLLASVFAQSYDNWELIVADASNNKRSSAYLEDRTTADVRIRYIKTVNEGIALNTNKGIEASTGDLIAFLDHDDTLDPDALAESVEVFLKHPTCDLVYSDEDKISDDGLRYFEPHFKPDFSLDMLRNVNYITHFVVAQYSFVKKLGGLRSGFDGAQDYDFLLRAVDSGAKIWHVPKVLYHWRQADNSTAANFTNKQRVLEAGVAALTDHYKRNNIKGVKVVAIAGRPGFYKPEYSLTKAKRAIHLNLDAYPLLEKEKEYIIERFRQNSDVQKYQILITTEKPSKEYAILTINGPYAPKNDKVELAPLFALAEEQGVAAVAPKILRRARIYDMGIVTVGTSELPLFKGVDGHKQLPFGSLEWVRNVNKLSGRAIIRGHTRNGRYIVWSHSEFCTVSSVPESERFATEFYNPNIVELSEITPFMPEYIADRVDVKQ